FLLAFAVAVATFGGVAAALGLEQRRELLVEAVVVAGAGAAMVIGLLGFGFHFRITAGERAEEYAALVLSGLPPRALRRSLALELAAGETVAIVGPSGSGKTTLIKILAAVEKPSHGRVAVAGLDLSSMGESQREDYRRRVVGYLWQQSEAGLWAALSAFENVQ